MRALSRGGIAMKLSSNRISVTAEWGRDRGEGGGREPEGKETDCNIPVGSAGGWDEEEAEWGKEK